MSKTKKQVKKLKAVKKPQPQKQKPVKPKPNKVVVKKKLVVKQKQKKVLQKPLQKVKKVKKDQKKEQKKLKTQSERQIKTKAISKIKQKPVKKKTLKVLDQKALERQQIKDEKLQKKQQSKIQKMAKLRIFELSPNENVPKVEINDFLEKPVDLSSKKKQPQRNFEFANCCIFCNNREALQCVTYGDLDGLKKCLKNIEQLSNPFQNFACQVKENILTQAIKTKNIEMLKVILDYEEQAEKGELNRVKLPIINLQEMTTGQANKLQFYFPIRKIQLSRGGKEGNNAFTHDKSLRKQSDFDYDKILKLDPPLSIVQLLQTKKESFLQGRNMKTSLGLITMCGNYDLLKYVVKKAQDNLGYGFNKLHAQAVLQGAEAEAVKGINKSSLLKKGYDTYQLMPGHYAAINPDITILRRFFKVHPSGQVQDSEQRDITHYAAANHSSEAIEFLISKKVPINNRDLKGITPLMIACKLGRTQNVKAILDDQQKQLNDLDKSDPDFLHYQSFYKYVNQSGPFKNTPLHFACKLGHLSIVKLLLEEGHSDIDSKNFYGNTPLSVASEKGHLKIVQYLVEKGANIHGNDKQLRSPLIRACINGQIHIVAYLLRKGVSPNFKDASENTALHYACAYGWLNIVKLLIQSGSDPNLLNEWKASSILIAMLKGHFGIVDYLINLDQLNASFQDDEGRTLIAQLCMNINEESAKNLKFLLDKRKIDAKLVDYKGFSPLHHLASNNIYYIADESVRNKEKKEAKTQYLYRRGKKVKVNRRHYDNNAGLDKFLGYFKDEKDKAEYDKKVQELHQSQIKCADLLIREGLSTNQQTEEGEMTPLFITVMCQNYRLSDWLISQDPHAIQGKELQNGQNILHLLALKFYEYKENLLPIIVQKNKKECKLLSQQYDNQGYTPYLLYFQQLEVFQVQNLQHYQFTEVAKNFFKQNNLIRSLNIIIENSEIYAHNLEYDISSYIGMNKQQKERLEKLKTDNLITEEEYQLLSTLQYDENVHQEKYKMDIDEKNKIKNYQYDDLTKFNPKKQKMGLLNEIVDNNQQVQNQQQKPTRRHYMASAHINPASRKIKDSEQDTIQLQGKYFNTFKISLLEKYEIKTQDFYSEVNCKQTSLHILLKFAKQVQLDSEQLLISLFTLLLKLSLDFKTKDNIYYQGFNKFNKQYENILFQAIRQEQKQYIQEIFDSQAVNLDLQSFSTKLGALHYLGIVKNKEIIDNILKMNQKFNINMVDNKLNTPLHYAAYLRNQHLLQQLLKFGSNVNAVNKYGYNPIHCSLAAFSENLDHTPKIERILIDSGINLNFKDQDGRTPVFYLFFRNSIDKSKIDPSNIIMALFQTKQIEINIQDKNLNTPLHYACQRGATISALTLLNNGADISKKNILGNSPFAEALQNNQSDLCVFLIQQECNFKESVKTASSLSKSENYQKLQKYIIPDILYESIQDQNIIYKDQLDYINQNYKIKDQSSFFLALQKNQGGMGYLLLSKDYDLFDALVSCLKTCKFERFIDLIENQQDIDKYMKKVDLKKRNLLFILVKNYANQNSTNTLERCLEIIDLLENDYNLDLLSADINDRNIFHYLGIKNQHQLFFKLLQKLKPNKIQYVMNLKDKQQQAIPIVYLLQNLAYLQSEKFEILDLIDLKSLNLSYIVGKAEANQQQNKIKIPYYLLENNLYPFYEVKEQYETTLLHQIVRNLSQSVNEQQQYKIFQSLKEKGLNFNRIEPETGLTVLMQAILMNSKFIVHSLLGFEFDIKLADYVIKQLPIVDVDQQDNLGKTALHYAILPSKTVQWTNQNCLEELLKAKANPLLTDQSGKNALDYAINQPISYQLILKYHPHAQPAKNKAIVIDQIQKSIPKISDDEIKQIQEEVKYDYIEDSQKFIDKMIEKIKQEKMQMDGVKNAIKKDIEVDEVSKLKNCEVLKQNGLDELYYDALLIKIDIKKHYYGICNFYVIQLLYDKLKKLYILWTRWGRIGDIGQYQRTPFNKQEEAEKEFKKVFRQKTGQNWDQLDNYQAIPRKYKVKRLHGKVIFESKDGQKWKYSDRQLDVKDLLVDFSLHNYPKSKLSDSQYDFIQCLVDQSNQLRKIQNYGIKKGIFLEGILDPEILENLKNILLQIQALQKEKEEIRKQRNFDKFCDINEKIFDLSNEYYEATMPTQFTNQGLFMIQNEDQIQTEMTKIEIIYDFEHVTKLLFAALYRINEINPYDYCYKQLNSKIIQIDIKPERPIKTNNNKSDYNLIPIINQTIKFTNLEQNFDISKHLDSQSDESSSNPSHNFWNLNTQKNQVVIKNIFKIEQDNSKKQSQFQKQLQAEKDKIFNETHNHFMLFHGTSNANVLSIIEQGLNILPRHASRFHGASFGSGIYFADQYDLAQNYSDKNLNNGIDFCVLVCEVALGNICNALQQEDIQQMGKGYQSLRMMSRRGPNFNNNLIRPDGSIWPIGNITDYENPIYEQDDKKFKTLEEVANYENEQKKKSPVKEEKKQKKQLSKQKMQKKKNDQDDIEMIDTSSKPQEEQQQQINQKVNTQGVDYQEKIDLNKKKYKIDPHVISVSKTAWNNYNYKNPAYYQLEQSQYVVFNPSQVKVRYIMHLQSVNVD